VPDPRSGGQVVLAAAPIGRRGAVVGFLDLDGLGPGLAASLGGPRDLEFLVIGGAGGTVLAWSVDQVRKVGAPAAGSPFARPDGPAARRGLDGVTRLYGVAAVDGVGWTVYAGADRGQAVAAANRLGRRELWITLAGLLVILAAAVVISRHIARPIQRLSAGVRAATRHTGPGPIAVSGPAEVVSLADDFGSLIAAVDKELDAASRLAAIVESSTDAMIGKTLDGRIASWNAGAELMYGYSAEEAIGRNVAMLVPPDRPDEGLGTTIRAYLPAVDEPVPPPGAAGARTPPRGHGETIVVVEDEEAMRKVTCRMLRRNGYAVLEAATGPAALSLVAGNDCQLPLTDVGMPQISGPELAEEIHRRRPELPVLFMSGYSAGVLGPQRTVDDGVALIQKPFDENALLDRVHTALAAARAEVRPAGR